MRIILTFKEQHMARASARHILVKTEEQCNQLKTDIENGAEFAELAQQHSLCPSGKEGGDLGEFGPGQMVKEFDTVVFSAPVGEVQGPVKTQFGYHLVEVTQRSD
ncbi:MAG TPA: peptidylprolyl isomerase [Nitrosomonas sp.]|nr:peptidylprolyl isomerase [Nitrosomonas sp.]